MSNILNTRNRRHAIALADRLAASAKTDPSLLDGATPEQIRAAEDEMLLRAKQCVDEVARLHAEVIERARNFVALTEEFIASRPVALGGDR